MSKVNSTVFAVEKARIAASVAQFGTVNLTDLTNAAVNNVGASVFNIGDVINCEAIEASDVVKQKFPGSDNVAYFVLVEGTNAVGVPFAKRLYFSTLTRSIPKYQMDGEKVVPAGTAVSAADFTAGKAVYDEMMACPNLAKQLETLMSYKTLKVEHIEEVKTARYQNGVQLNTLRTAKLPIFSAER